MMLAKKIDPDISSDINRSNIVSVILLRKMQGDIVLCRP